MRLDLLITFPSNTTLPPAIIPTNTKVVGMAKTMVWHDWVEERGLWMAISSKAPPFFSD